MIWDQICEEPRIVEVEVHSYPNPQYIPKISDPVDFGFTPQGPVAALLHVCNEARHQGLKRYTRVLQRQVNADHVADSIIQMSLENDTLLILPPKMQPTDQNFFCSVHTSFFKSATAAQKSGQIIRQVAIPMPPTAELLDWTTIITLKYACGLKEVMLVRNWETREESQSGVSSNSQHCSYAHERSLLEPEASADMEGEALIKVLKAVLDQHARRYPMNEVVQAKQAKFLFRTLTRTRSVRKDEVGLGKC
ncbi:hypothetical protein L207DRAFT_511819 [Hyaloscypha variabilis F]|uniref:2EXR domain-containing protein n=1 Tax=Hyaloscypha variabilis (strain UAMH 11265 / GT02V1 / F) TaxID=1149755 RepID=A0A2J6RP55_HYAVF|nr:hypothetical protein L207DRAFT_511819 [Hyaloscypha variabilis F]